MNETGFYVLGTIAAVLAVAVTAFGLRSREAFSSKSASLGLIALFTVLVLGTATFAVLLSEDEQEHREAELAAEEAEEGAEPVPGGGEVPAPDAPELGDAGSGKQGGAQPAAQGPGGTLALAADPTQLAFDKPTLASKPGEVTIELDNPAPIPHDVAIEKGGSEIAKSEQVAEATTSVSAALAAGDYVFFCSVPGHREAGMEGTLTVK